MPDIDFLLRGEYIALHQLLKLTGTFDSGGQAKQAVATGQVQVDGHPESRKACKIRAGQTVQCANRRIRVLAEPAA